MLEIIKEAIKVASEDSRCQLCGSTIKKGDSYKWSKLSNNGRVYTFKAHLECNKVAGRYGMYDDVDSLEEDDFFEGIEDLYSDLVVPTISTFEKVKQLLVLNDK